jgi:hypothetical protein
MPFAALCERYHAQTNDTTGGVRNDHGHCFIKIERYKRRAGRPIVSDSWIDACGRSGSFVDPVDHLLMDTTAQKKFGFDMRTSYERAQHQLLLTGLHVFFTPGIQHMLMT